MMMRMAQKRALLFSSALATAYYNLRDKNTLPVTSINSDSSASIQRVVTASYSANSPNEDRSISHTRNDWIVGGIFDGHGGWQVSEFASTNFINTLMPKLLLKDSGAVEEISNTLSKTFEDIEKSYIDLVRSPYNMGFRDVGKVGACSLVAVRKGPDLYVANCGDCRAVLGSSVSNSTAGQTKPDRYLSTRLSRDHNARVPLEALLLKHHHSDESDIIVCKNPHACYVKGRLQLTRALGDLYLKHAEFNTPKIGTGSKAGGGRYIPNPYSPPYVSAVPEVTHILLDPGDSFLILASDGVWDFLSDQEAVDVVVGSIKAHNGDTSNAAQDLVNATLTRAAEINSMTLEELKAIREGSERRKKHDDTTAVVMFL